MEIGDLKNTSTRDLYLLMAGFESKLRNGGLHCNQDGYKYAYMKEIILRDLKKLKVTNKESIIDVIDYGYKYKIENINNDIEFNLFKKIFIELDKMENNSGVVLSSFKYYKQYINTREKLLKYYLDKIKISGLEE